MLRKMTIAVILCLTVIAGIFSYTGGAKISSVPISIYVNEKEIATDVDAFIKNGTTFVPIRAICNAMSIDNIVWNESNKTATIKTDRDEIQFTANESYAYFNGKRHNLSAPVVIKNGRTMIPLRFLAECLGADVDWDSLYYCVDITKDGITVPDSCKASDYTKEDIMWLAKIIEAESAGEPVTGQIAVGNVILNRVASADYPNTIYGVIFDAKHGIQFQPVANGTIYNTPSRMCVASAKRALRGENYVGNCLFFLNEELATNKWIVANRDYYTTINNHSFYA